MFGHIPEILALLLVALLVFGPKRMVEMGSSFGKAFRELRDATREMSWSNLLSEEPQPIKTTGTQASQSFSTIQAEHEEAAANARVVEGSIEHDAHSEVPPA